MSGVIIPASCPGPGVAPPSNPPAPTSGVALGSPAAPARISGVSSQRERVRLGVGPTPPPPPASIFGVASQFPDPPAVSPPATGVASQRLRRAGLAVGLGASAATGMSSHSTSPELFGLLAAGSEVDGRASTSMPSIGSPCAAASLASAAAFSASSRCFCAICLIVLSFSRSSCASLTRSA